MPDREFLETYPLYRKFKIRTPIWMSNVVTPPVHMYCSVCDSEQTFIKYHNSAGGHNLGSTRPEDALLYLIYRCQSCNKAERAFLIRFDKEGEYTNATKIGQDPPWDISIDRDLARLLKNRVGYFKKGLISESQGYGIGAFAYYRRIVEEVLDDLLNDIADLIVGEEREHYLNALERVKKTHRAEEKIALVKDLLPTILRLGGVNPLAVLYDVLSKGLHRETEDECLTLAEEVRISLVFLVRQVMATKNDSKQFTESMQKLLSRKNSATQ